MQLLISLLPQADFTELKREMTRRDIDYNNPHGPLMLACFKDFCMIERNAMEGEITDEIEPQPQPQKQPHKPKGTHGAVQTDQSQMSSSSEDECISSSHGSSAYIPKQNPPVLKFPCPLNNHKHETMVCTQFFALCPKDRWDKIEKRKVCWNLDLHETEGRMPGAQVYISQESPGNTRI